jgi:hypothetical protein
MKVILIRGLLNGQIDENFTDDCLIYRRSSSGPLGRYRNTGQINATGYHIFEWWPPTNGEPDVTKGVYDA